jgi:hypothetical protein
MAMAISHATNRLHEPIFVSLDLADYQAQLDRALAWLLSVPDPRETSNRGKRVNGGACRSNRVHLHPTPYPLSPDSIAASSARLV